VAGLFGIGELELMQSGGDISRHGEVDRALVIIPVEFDSTIVEGAIPIGGCFVVFFEGIKQVVGALLANVLDTEVIQYK
jgi:hypothetical protein